MATVKAPCFSASATGSIGKALIFSSWKGKAVAKGSYLKDFNGYYFTRRIPDSETIKQNAVRDVFSNACEVWGSLPQYVKDEYSVLSKGKALTGFNIFIGDYIRENIDFNEYAYAYLLALYFGIINEASKIRSERLAKLGRLNERNN